MRGAWRDESAAALAFSALAMGLVLVGLLFAVVAVAVLASARAELAEAADAAALAAATGARVQATLAVRYLDYQCDAQVPQRCVPGPGATTEALADGDAFAVTPSGAFGPRPAWAALAGCLGTVWPNDPLPAGTYRICTGQTLVAATPVPGDMGQMQGVAAAWLAANIPAGGILTAPQVLAVRIGAAGQVTVVARARISLGLPLVGAVQASSTAWPAAT